MLPNLCERAIHLSINLCQFPRKDSVCAFNIFGGILKLNVVSLHILNIHRQQHKNR